MTENKSKEQKSINPEWLQATRKLINQSPYYQLQKMTLEDITWGAARVDVELGKRHLQSYDVVHGGVFASLIDAAGFWAVYSHADADHGIITVELKLNYLAPVAEGRLIGFGRCIKLGRTIGLGEARIETVEKRVVAHGTTTVMVQPSRAISGKDFDVPKFL